MPKLKNKPKTETVSIENREVLYPELKIVKYIGAKAMTAGVAKQLFGWQTEQEYIEEKLGADVSEEDIEAAGVKFKDDYFVKDGQGNKVRCLNNVHNRPLTDSWVEQLAYDILNKHWRLNGETIIIGKTGVVLSAQHRLMALIRAYELWSEGKQSHHWQDVWDGEPTIETIVVFGIAEDPDTTRTHDNVKPRSLADVIFADHAVFADMGAKDRKGVARALDFAIRLLWLRTGAKNNPFAPHRSHAEALDFWARHRTLDKVIRHIWEENVDDKIGQFITPGYAAALMYLMAASKTDTDDYIQCDPRSEKVIDWSMMDKAEEFWTLFGNAKETHDLRLTISGSGGSLLEKTGIICKAWNQFRDGKKMTAAKIKVNVAVDEETGARTIQEWPDVGGIDLGPKPEKPERDEPEDEPEPTEEELAEVEIPEEVEAPTPKQRKPRKSKAMKEVLEEEAVPEAEIPEGFVEEVESNGVVEE